MSLSISSRKAKSMSILEAEVSDPREGFHAASADQIESTMAVELEGGDKHLKLRVLGSMSRDSDYRRLRQRRTQAKHLENILE